MSHAACLPGPSETLLLLDCSHIASSFDACVTLTEAYRHFAEPISRCERSVPDRFAELAEEWRQETGALSSISQIVLHSSYQEIIGLGRPALPLILAELEERPDHWFWALRAIAGVDPVPEEDRGSVRRMAAAWLAWARDSGLAR